MSRNEWHAKTMALVEKHNLGFLFNPGGGQFTNPDIGVNIHVAAYGDDEDDYKKLLAGLQKLGLEPPSSIERDPPCPSISGQK